MIDGTLRCTYRVVLGGGLALLAACATISVDQDANTKTPCDCASADTWNEPPPKAEDYNPPAKKTSVSDGDDSQPGTPEQ